MAPASISRLYAADGRAIRTGIVHHRDAHTAKLAIGQLNLILELLAPHWWNLRRDERLRTINQHPGQLAICRAHDPSTRRIRRR